MKNTAMNTSLQVEKGRRCKPSKPLQRVTRRKEEMDNERGEGEEPSLGNLSSNLLTHRCRAWNAPNTAQPKTTVNMATLVGNKQRETLRPAHIVSDHTLMSKRSPSQQLRVTPGVACNPRKITQKKHNEQCSSRKQERKATFEAIFRSTLKTST